MSCSASACGNFRVWTLPKTLIIELMIHGTFDRASPFIDIKIYRRRFVAGSAVYISAAIHYYM